MAPTFQNGDWVVARKSKYERPERFDVVIAESEKDNLIKRIIALEGESLEIKEGDIYINDKKIEDPFANGKLILREGDLRQNPPIPTSYVNEPKIQIKKNHAWLIGDNRKDSWYGQIDIKKIKALVIF